jgi:hypothetical protein
VVCSMHGSGHAYVFGSSSISEEGGVSLAGVGLLHHYMDMGLFQDGDRLSLRWSNERPGVDAGLTLLFAFSHRRPRAIQAGPLRPP